MSQILFFWFEKCEVARYIKNGSTSLPRYLQKLKFKYFDMLCPKSPGFTPDCW